MNMPQKGITTGLTLILLGCLGYFAGGMVSVTALIPAFFGVPLVLVSFLAKAPARRKLWMHFAVLIGFLGFIAPLGRIIPTAIKGEFAFGLATACMIAMSVVCLMFVIRCIQSFKAARQG